MELLNKYNNGNVSVSIYDDGTLIREYEGEPLPEFPSSMDIKITNYCNGAFCQFCHEKSNPNGKHGDLNKLLEVISVLPGGAECAIGGGNALSHPDLIPFLQTLKDRGIIANITINEKHILEYNNLILDLINNDLVKGIGISYSDKSYLPNIVPIIKASNNIVFHLIMGLNKVDDIDTLESFCAEQNKKCKILILGYKQFGNGINYYLKKMGLSSEDFPSMDSFVVHTLAP